MRTQVRKCPPLLPSGLNPPLLALLVDLRYSISIFVCRLVVTEKISGGEGRQLSLCPLSRNRKLYYFAGRTIDKNCMTNRRN